ncbi:Mobilization protein [Sphingobacterium sp. PM2-P1-29]|nr:Mobilization protein [Sphingobacterium sp. PM2-P1-29]
MKEKQNNRLKWLTVRVSEAEYAAIQKQFKQTTERKLSAYVRKILLGKPMIKEVRNASLQEIIAVLARMQKDLNGLTNNYNQMIHKLHITDTKTELKAWIERYEKEKQMLFLHIETISSYIGKTSEKWLQ